VGRRSVKKQALELHVNGRARQVEVEPRMLLVHALRDELGLTGTHVGCDTSQCGACTVLVDGRAVKSCAILAVQADGREIVTIEGVASGAVLHPVQQAFRDQHALQCGFCTPGMVLTAIDLLEARPAPSAEEIKEGLDGNYCRCTGYLNIIAAVAAVGHGD